jgi:hypothetical protein
MSHVLVADRAAGTLLELPERGQVAHSVRARRSKEWGWGTLAVLPQPTEIVLEVETRRIGPSRALRM